MNRLERFLNIKENIYNQAFNEVKNGKKLSHWMWFIFPQINGLGMSDMAINYAIKDINEAKLYLNNKILNKRLFDITKLLLNQKTNIIEDIFGYIDSLKLKSSMTLFHIAQGNNKSLFKDVLDIYYNGNPDEKTIEIITKQN